MRLQRVLRHEEETLALGRELAALLQGRFGGDACVWLHGDLGAGKTTLSRGILRAFGHQGAVKSPTYTLVEPYEVGDLRILHLDLYRIAKADELAFVGLDDLLAEPGIRLIEWPERAADVLPPADISVTLTIEDDHRRAEVLVVTTIQSG
jgi:tRNA threonylcarbamoyladenosine biosynthesis protein TsaE